ncbi:uncharacterized protein Z519_01104 [Cladophialophora bantiana CBS 173.52]|uniref:Uncharacterized protein n=1 Tax=Cladophialophora bantiana (strain ATCC 10958 / CBS 173.52 / CDC B-1940 / NIH 8579) TaxID=1442370 RepID=A0A0D2I2Z5_CLAB1|nr:uncharacterized protein Z519_01104 [Cladophialophora bantiana CBS 173.52]KIW97520.1 hypothetical protein Z519_01104 [Cladophialophora bantiana CBS 173.52]
MPSTEASTNTKSDQALASEATVTVSGRSPRHSVDIIVEQQANNAGTTWTPLPPSSIASPKGVFEVQEVQASFPEAQNLVFGVCDASPSLWDQLKISVERVLRRKLLWRPLEEPLRPPCPWTSTSYWKCASPTLMSEV